MAISLIIITAGSITAFAAAPSFRFTVTMDEAVNIDTTGGVPSIPVNVGGQTRAALYTAGTGTSSLTFTYTATPGDLDLDGIAVSSPVARNGGIITDLAGNPIADADLAFTPPITTGVRINYPSLSMDFANDRYSYNGTTYNSFAAFRTASNATFTNGTNGTYFDSAGILRKVSTANTPRIDYDPVTHAIKGLLVEENKTNLISTANMGNWNYDSTVSSLATGSGAFGQTSYILGDTSNSVRDPFRISVAGVADTSYTFSIFVKKNSSYNNLNALLRFRYNDVTYGGVFINPATGGTASYFSPTNFTSQDYGDYWRFSVTVRESTKYPLYFEIFAAHGASGGLTGEIEVFGPQIEEGTFPSSYIPTSGTTVTRESDNFLIPTTGGWYNQPEGTAIGDISYLSSAGTNFPMLWRFDNGTSSTNDRWNAYYVMSLNTVRFDGFTGGVVQGVSNSFNSSTSASAKFAAAMSANNTRVAMDGTLGTLLTTWTPPTITQFRGSIAAAAKWTKTFRYYPLRVSDTQLQLLSQ